LLLHSRNIWSVKYACRHFLLPILLFFNHYFK
jgi:hypothetical protein